MLLSKGIFNIHSTSQRSKEPIRFRFPDVKPRRRSSKKSRSDDPSSKEQDKPRTVVPRAEGLRNVLSILGKLVGDSRIVFTDSFSVLMLAIKVALGMVYSIPLPNLPELSKVLPTQIAKPYFYMFLFPAIAMFGKYDEGSMYSVNLIVNDVIQVLCTLRGRSLRTKSPTLRPTSSTPAQS